MEIWLTNIIPIGLIELLPAITLIVIGWIVEKRYVGRVAIFSNAVALTTYFYKFSKLPYWLVVYINALIIVGILALISYVFRFYLPRSFYYFAAFFSSCISGIILLWGMNL